MKKKPSPPKPPATAVKSKPLFRHRLGKEYVRRAHGESRLVRFTVAEQLARGGDHRDISTDGIEVIKTGKGSYMLFDASLEVFRFFKTLDEVIATLDLGAASHRAVFTALGGSIEKAIPEV
jgi:hypothetical protein